MASKATPKAKAEKTHPSAAILEGWAEALDAAVEKRFGVKTETRLNILSGSMVTGWPEDLDVASHLMIRVFIEGYMLSLERCQQILLD